MATHHLAQFNVARFHKPLEDPANVDFTSQLDEVNAQAERAPGFVWRAKDESGNSTAMDPYGDPLVIINFSVWVDRASLRAYTLSGDHLALLKRRREWFEEHARAHHALWWIPAGHEPSVPEAVARLDHLREHGSTPYAFAFRDDVPPPVDGPYPPA